MVRAEALGVRRLLSTQQWTNTVGGSFGDPGNWAAGVVPGAGETAAFNLANSGTATLDANRSLAGLSVADPT